MELKIEKQYRVLLGDDKRVNIILVGVGGTGSRLAASLARLAVHARRKGIHVDLTFIDPDTVDERIIGRQNFSFAELGYNKAVTMAFRLNAAFGLDIVAIADGFHRHMTDSHAHPIGHALLVGAVDNERARQEMARAVIQANGGLYWLDTGNARWNGQCLIGNLPKEQRVNLDMLGLCSGLPAPHVQEPGLLEPDPEEPRLSCAELVMREEQSLFVNQAAAAVAAQYAYQFVLQRELTSFDTRFNLMPFVASTKNITRANLSRYLSEEPRERNGARGA
jgi:PRTRC genetic system ThiF family protein